MTEVSAAEKKAIEKRLKDEGPKRWYHTFEVIKGSGIYTPGQGPKVNYEATLKNLGVDPTALRGQRVLDIGTYSGAIAFFLEDLGADVVTIDIQDPVGTGFNLVRELRQSSAKFEKLSVYDLSPDVVGTFDCIVFFGVIYHLKHPILALERLNSVCNPNGMIVGGGASADAWFHDSDPSCSRGAALDQIGRKQCGPDVLTVDTVSELPLCGFARDHFHRDVTNWFIPTQACMEAWLKRTGFEVKSIRTGKSSLVREWVEKEVTKSSVQFCARRIGDPEKEYPPEVYEKKYNEGTDWEPVMEYRIPTEMEVQLLRRRVGELEERLRSAS